ncbi:MAG: SDR family NAD(P)-dependent oxidoreductase [Caldilineaceae bacterium]
MNAQPLLDQIAIVTGGAQGLGAIRRRLADEGAHVVVADLNGEKAQETAAEIAQATGRSTLGKQVDVTDEAQVAALVDETVAALGRLDIMVANAASSSPGRWRSSTSRAGARWWT